MYICIYLYIHDWNDPLQILPGAQRAIHTEISTSNLPSIYNDFIRVRFTFLILIEAHWVNLLRGTTD